MCRGVEMRFAAIFALLLFAGLCLAQADASGHGTRPTGMPNITVAKTGPSEVAYGEAISITISITNNDATPINATAIEYAGAVNPVDPPQFHYVTYNSSQGVGVQPPYYQWDVELLPGARNITYRVSPKIVGVLSMGSTYVYAGGFAFNSNPLTVRVTCSVAGQCNPAIGEDYYNCPQKCLTPPSEIALPPTPYELPETTPTATPTPPLTPTPAPTATPAPTPVPQKLCPLGIVLALAAGIAVAWKR